MKQFRHGDLLLHEVLQIPEGCQENPDGVLLEGEHTGHAHRVAPGARVLTNERGIRYVQVLQPTPLSHEEHHTIELPVGLYQVVRQREFSGESGTMHWVTD